MNTTGKILTKALPYIVAGYLLASGYAIMSAASNDDVNIHDRVHTHLLTVEATPIENVSASNRVSSGFNVGRRTTKYNFDLSVSEVHTTYDGLYPDRDVYYSYDDCGRKTQMLVTEHRTRDGVAYTDSATIKYEYGPTGMMEAVVMGPSRKKITYDIHGWQVKAETELKRSYDGNYVERLYYADSKAAHPRYNGFVSRKEWQKHAYDYEYDPNGFLIDAAYSELPGNDQATGANQGVKFDRSVSFEYDVRGNVKKIQRKGVIDRHPSGKLTFGLLDNLEASYTGNRLTRMTRPVSLSSDVGTLQTNDMDMTAAFDGVRDGWIKNPDIKIDYAVEVFKPKYDAAGRLVSDDSRNVTDAVYDNNGYLTEVTVGGCSVKYSRDGFGNLLRAEYSTPDGSGKDVKGDMSDRTVLYDGDGHMAVNGTLEMSRFEGGYFDADGNPHYYLTDYQGNVVRVIDREGSGGQPMDYYPYGEPWLEWDWTLADTYPNFIKNRFLYGGKERITQFGLGLYNFEARMYRAQWIRFSTPDKKAIDTPWLSPFAYCACNPVNAIDPTGEDVVVLNYTEGWHIAMLIQNKDKKWQYYSINGDNVYSFGNHIGGRPFNDVSVGFWDTPDEFLNSSYNVRDDDSKLNMNKNHYGFSEGYHIPSTPEQDKIMRDAFIEKANSDYNLLTNNCATVVQEVLIEAGIPVSQPSVDLSTYPIETSFGIVNGFRACLIINVDGRVACLELIFVL